MEDRKSQNQNEISKLALTVKVGEYVDLDGGRIRVVVKAVNRYGRNQVQLVFLAPRSVPIRRLSARTTAPEETSSGGSERSDPSQT